MFVFTQVTAHLSYIYMCLGDWSGAKRRGKISCCTVLVKDRNVAMYSIYRRKSGVLGLCKCSCKFIWVGNGQLFRRGQRLCWNSIFLGHIEFELNVTLAKASQAGEKETEAGTVSLQ